MDLQVYKYFLFKGYTARKLQLPSSCGSFFYVLGAREKRLLSSQKPKFCMGNLYKQSNVLFNRVEGNEYAQIKRILLSLSKR